ncbi:hypothetical protein [Chromobacterium subtsugae]|uniref:hypothetical protein n=1 Tax=Chromobacterium subtsugae TaxID=251747 RepID=UPI000B19B528|nr:hypothetical protein [Chromobacterium subtsugae]
MHLPPETLTTEEQLAEFDQWLTAKLERIKESSKFASEIDALCDCINKIAPYLDNFQSFSNCSIDNLCDASISASLDLAVGDEISDDEERVANFYNSFFNLLFLTSGATDNNLKNHFLIKLNEGGISPLIPKRSTSKSIIKYRLFDIPSTTKSDLIAKLLASCLVGSHSSYISLVKTEPVFDLRIYHDIFFKEYVSLILEENEDVMQFWAICRSYINLNNISKDIDYGRYLLNSCTIFKVRGSVSASSGHVTEEILRDKLKLIGLQPEIDFNISDVTIGEEVVLEDGKRKKKTRAYDFIIPYKIEKWEPRPKLFIQSQFYAGDSGSVSHKVVDQTQSARHFTLGKYPNARFVEYLDGAGYYAALRGDLAHMLTFENTASFFQVKSIFIRLRREFQNIEYLTPVEFEHAIMTTDTPSKDAICTTLRTDGYSKCEIERIEEFLLVNNYISISDGMYNIMDNRIATPRRLLIIDVAAKNGYHFDGKTNKNNNILLIPGYGKNFGILQSDLARKVCETVKSVSISPYDFECDIEWLLEDGVMKRY